MDNAVATLLLRTFAFRADGSNNAAHAHRQ
jgi:hypothetical protein